MPSLNRLHVLLLVALLCCGQQAWAGVTVRFEPSEVTYYEEDLFTLDLVADISDPVIGWGLDLTIEDPLVLSLNGPPMIGPLWYEGYAPDGDGLVGLAFDTGISGNDILLATISLQAVTMGDTDLYASVTPGDLTEGFPLDPTGFADVTFESGHVIVIPEPAAVVLLAAGGWLVVRFRRRRG